MEVPGRRRTRAVVTGASSGLGREFARELARRGFDLVVSARREEALDALAHELSTTCGVSVQVVAADLEEPDGVDRLADAILAGPVPRFVVNNAGAGQFGLWLNADGEGEQAMLRLNVEAPTRLARRLVPAMAAERGGRLLNVASVGAFVPGPRLAVYYATRAYILSWSRALAEEFRGTGVTVTCVCPGPMPTGFQARAGFQSSGRGRTGDDPRRVAMEGVEAALAGRPVAVPGWRNRITALLARLLPGSWMARLVHRVQRRREPGG